MNTSIEIKCQKCGVLDDFGHDEIVKKGDDWEQSCNECDSEYHTVTKCTVYGDANWSKNS